MYTYCVFLLDHYLCRHAKLNLMDSRQRVIYFLKTKPHRWFTHTHIYNIRMESNTFFIMSFYIYVEYMFYYICTITEEYRYNVLINVIQIPSLEFRTHAHTQIMYNHNN